MKTKIALTIVIPLLLVIGLSSYFNKTEYVAPVNDKTVEELTADKWLVAQKREKEQKQRVDELRAQLDDEIIVLLRLQKETSKAVLEIIAHSGYASSSLDY